MDQALNGVVVTEPTACGERKGTRPARTVVSLFPLWLIGWLFTIGYLHPTFWKAVLAILIWPYLLGSAQSH